MLWSTSGVEAGPVLVCVRCEKDELSSMEAWLCSDQVRRNLSVPDEGPIPGTGWDRERVFTERLGKHGSMVVR